MAKPAARKGDTVQHIGKPAAPIIEGSQNVLINGLPAARMGDKSPHGGNPEPIAQGSGSVFINGMNAARVDDLASCGGPIISGSGNVFIGDGPAGKACSMCPGGVAAKDTKPVNPILGAKVLFGPEDLDFALPGAFPLVWQRSYSSYVGPAGFTAGLLGFGWRLPFEMHLQLSPKATLLFDSKGRTITFDPLRPGEGQYSPYESFYLLRGGRYQPERNEAAAAAPGRPKQGAAPSRGSEPHAVGSVGAQGFHPKPWQDDPQWSHIPPEWRSLPGACMAATPERSVWLFVALAPEPQADTRWILLGMIDVFGRRQSFEYKLQQPIPREQAKSLSKEPPKDLPIGSLLAITDGLGRRFVLHYRQGRANKALGDTRWRLEQVTLNRSTLVHYSYQDGDLVQVKDRHGRLTREFTYDHHRMASHRVLGGPKASYVYENAAPGARVVAHSIEDGLSFAFDYQDKHTTVTDSLGRVTTYGYAGEGGRRRLKTLTDPLGHTTRYEHTLEGHLVTETNALGHTTTILRDDHGNPTHTIGPDGSQSRTEWRNHTLVSSTDAAGRTTSFSHDSYGRLVKVTDPLGQTTTYVYADPQDPKEQLTAEHPRQIIDAKGGVKQLRWTREGQLARFTDCSQQSTHYAYDSQSLDAGLISVTNALGEKLSYQRNALGQVETITYPDQTQSRFHYTARGELLRSTDALGASTSYQRDAHGRVTRSQQAAADKTTADLHQVLSYAYDAAGRLTRLTNQNGALTTFQYDAADRLIEEVGFDLRTQRYGYNAIDQLIEARDIASTEPGAPELVTRYAYDKGGRLIERQIPPAPATQGQNGKADRKAESKANDEAETIRHRFAYDKQGQLVSASTPDNTVNFQRDALGRITEERFTSPAHTHCAQHSYDALGNRERSTYPFIGDVNFLAYGSGHVHQISLNQQPVLDLERDRLHRETRRQLMSGLPGSEYIRFEREIDPMGRLTRTKVHGGVETHDPQEPTIGGLARLHHYDPIGRLAAIGKPGYVEQHYAYDAANRLIAETVEQYPGPGNHQPHIRSHQRWHYDPAGNPTGANRAKQQNNRPQQDESHDYSYDAWGNTSAILHRQQGSLVRLAYDGLHQLQASQSGPDEPTIHYIYDALGRRVCKQHLRFVGDNQPPQIEKKEFYGWDGDRLITTQGDNHAVTVVYEPNSFVPMFRIDSTRQISFSQNPADHKLTKRLFYFHCNHLGTPEALIDGKTSKVVWEIELDPWGNTKRIFNPEKLQQPIRMLGQHLDGETGLFYNRYRYYNPRNGRYVTQDPFGLFGGNNAYSYAINPLSTVDPLGLKSERIEISKMKEKIIANNNSGQSDNLILCQAWKESGFNPQAKSKTSTATGLLQTTKAAVKDVNSNFKEIGPFEHSDMTDAEKSLSAGSAYLKLRIKWTKGNVAKGLDGFGTGPGYSDDILECEKCLNACQKTTLTCGSEQKCLDGIHK